MSATRQVLLGLVVILMPASQLPAGSKPDPREKVDTAVPEGIRLLDAKEYSSFLQKFVPPDDLKKLTMKAPLDEFAKEFGQTHAPRLLKVLQAIRGTNPTLVADGMLATFPLKEPIEGKKSITFIKVGKFWYIQN
jgi:hypothetical protein